MAYTESDACITDALVSKLLTEAAPPDAIYLCAGGHAGLVEALRTHAPHHRPIVVTHDLSADVHDGLMAGLIDFTIVQDAVKLARSCVRTAVSAYKGEASIVADREIGINIIMRSNCPSRAYISTA